MSQIRFLVLSPCSFPSPFSFFILTLIFVMEQRPDNHRFRNGRPRQGRRPATMNPTQMDGYPLERYDDYLESRNMSPLLADWLHPRVGPNAFPNEAVLRRPGGPEFAPARRPNLVVVILPRAISDPTQDQVAFNIKRDLLFAYLPEAQNEVRRGVLELGALVQTAVADEHPEHMMRWALRFILGHIERLSRTGDMDMFGDAEHLIDESLDRVSAVRTWASCMHGVCVVLEDERGLGCSDELLSHIMAFLEGLFQDVQNLLGRWQTSVLFEAFAGTFRTTRVDLVEQLYRIWDRFDPDVQDDIMHGIRAELVRDSAEGRAHRMYRTLQQRAMGLMR
ncbi:hypothetical protein EDB81DRAFT_778440 [Dactylonectria macrodidyma]|uniref:Uncharacterized protein n=1 Tax=Dactylonectria macrodidyma TaxID=307937 RepID=A0A9P9JHM0_9HYPO|nr:hypothetical protein EDB81DRAFT_778440 [Dactylonectria macrodidyma]